MLLHQFIYSHVVFCDCVYCTVCVTKKMDVVITGYSGLGLWYLMPFNNISVVSWWSVLLVEETRVPGENHRPAASHLQTITLTLAHSTKE